MKDTLYFIIDLFHYTLMGVLLVSLLHGMLAERFRYSAVLMCLQFLTVRQFFSHAGWAQQVIYGTDRVVKSSRQSILPIAVSLFATLAAGMLLYRRSRMKLPALVTAFYALAELVRFTFYPAAVWSINQASDYFIGRYIADGALGMDTFIQRVNTAECIWNLTITVLNAACLFLCIRWYKRFIKSGEAESGEAAVLFVPGLMGLLFTLMLRCILFYYSRELSGEANMGVHSLIEQYPELNLLIPVMSLLCIASILLSASMLDKLARENEMRQRAKLLWSSARELETYVQDMESVHLKIQGMKHDMKHHIADMNALLARMAAGDTKAGEEVRRYVDSMQDSLNELDLKFQTGNPVTDVVLGRYVRLAEQKKIAFSSDFIFPKHMGIDAFDLSVILNNGLDNAVEACEKEEEAPFISLHASRKGAMFFLTIENSFSGALHLKEGMPVSGKSGPGHGLGLKNIQNCAEKYYGRMEVQRKEGRFLLTVMLQGDAGLQTGKE